MRAGRVLDMLLTLQRRGRMTASELASRLEVSERTILRDVEALGEAGVPIYTVQGVGGGIELMDGFETRLTGLTTAEATAVFLADLPGVAAKLGLRRPARIARQKLLEAMSVTLRDEAESLGSWFVHEPMSAAGDAVPGRELRRIVSCIHRRRTVELTLGDAASISVDPLGLVLRAGSWRLVHSVESVVKTLELDELTATRITRDEFERPAGFSLEAFWRRNTQR